MDGFLSLDRVAKIANVDAAEQIEIIQELWSGYGQIVRVRLLDASLSGADYAKSNTVIVKHVAPPESRDHKYGWTGDNSHRRKLRSYDNETNWYRNASQYCSSAFRVPELIGADVDAKGGGVASKNWLLVLEDLDAAGFDLRRRRVTDSQLDACISWLANFHATFLYDAFDPSKVSPSEQYQLWPIGTYWHLDTRPDELEVMEAGPLKQAAQKIDAALSGARFQTLVHGDAKLANFCFAADDKVAAVDFQYVGGGCGMKDLAYFISSCFRDDECERREKEILDSYFRQLEIALGSRTDAKRSAVKPVSFACIEEEWRTLYSVAWADFYRFLAGWSPGHWKMHGYSKRVTDSVLMKFDDRP